ncbi:hypothetical protein PENSPDRAFT_428073 [Peniophora sp. CONT]|nr:hypothetical protein PENSPDRAFT_428073 [Peniophora sp. CONT]
MAPKMWDESIPLTELSHDGFKAWIEIEGTPLRLYLPNRARSTAKLEATGGKEFTICWKDTTGTGRDVASLIRLDGNGPLQGPVLTMCGSGVIRKSGVAATHHRVWPFTFVDNNVTVNSHQTGVIQLQLHIVQRLEQCQPRLSPDQPSLKDKHERLAAW